MSASSILLLRLRKGDYNWKDDPEQGMLLLVTHQSEFPVKIRDAIQEATHESNAGESNEWRIFRIFDAVSSFMLCKPENEDAENETKTEAETPWKGPDSAVDTEDEIELAIRFFPNILRETRPLDEVWEWDFFPIFWMTTCLKSLSFVPLLAALGNEYQIFEEKEQGGMLNTYQIRKGSPLLQIVTNKFIMYNQPTNDKEFNRKVDDASLSVLVRLKEKGFVREKDAWDCIENLLNETPSRTDKRLRFFLDWDPAILLIKDNQNVALFKRRFKTSLLEEFLNRCHQGHVEDGMLERFQTIFELGLRHFPEQIGFLFHRAEHFLFEPAFRKACKIFGEEKVTRVVNEVILRYSEGQCNTIQKLVFIAATNDRVLFDGLHFLVRRDPTAIIPLLMKETATKTATEETMKRTVIHRTIQILLVWVLMAGIWWMCLRPKTFFIPGEL